MALSRINEAGALRGTISTNTELRGQISLETQLTGTLTAPQTLTGIITVPTVLKGTINPTPNLKGTIAISSSSQGIYQGNYTVTPKVTSQKLQTKDKLMKDDVVVLEIPYYETSNISGKTVYIGGE